MRPDFDKFFIEHLLYPIMKWKNRNQTMKYIAEMKETQHLSREEMSNLQMNKLKKLLTDAVENVPAYREYRHLIDEIQENPASALTKFPILEKSYFRAHSELFLNRRFSLSEGIPNQTGGSTGESTKFYMDRITVEHYEAARWRGLSWYGITPGSRSIMIWGNPLELSRKEQKREAWKDKFLKNRILLSAYALNSSSIEQYARLIRRYKPEYLYGYASALNAFALLMLEKGIRIDTRLKAIVSTAETLYDFQRENISRAFACPVVNEYGARDAGILAYQCKSGHLHLSCENAFIETVDPVTLQPLPAGSSGSAVITDLNNYFMPRLRYKLGDEIILSDKTCDCGIRLPLLESVCGREDDMIRTPDGLLVHGHLLVKLSLLNPSVQKFQIIQHSVDSVELKLVISPDGTSEEASEFVKELEKFLPKVHINVIFCEDIPHSSSGKFRYTVGM